jgi:gentisate 1,2-dioxygenase
VVYVLDGRGSTTFEIGGQRRTFEWGRGSLFSLPVNAHYRHFNASGDHRARLANVTNLPMVMKLFRDEDFVFDTAHDFSSRLTDEKFLRGEGTFIPTREHRHMWETNLVPDLLTFDQLRLSPGRGAGSSNIMFVLADGTLHAHCSEIPVGGYKKAHIHGEGYHIFQLSGEGYSLYWYKDQEPTRIDWQYGMLHSPPNQMWHQHFNVSDEPARYLAIGFGSFRYPFLGEKMAMLDRTYTTKSAFQIDYEDEDPAIRRTYDAERQAWQKRRSAVGA